MTRSYLRQEKKESVTVATICSRSIYPCAVCTRVFNAFLSMSALDWSSVVAVTAEANLRGHTIGIAGFGIFGETIMSAVEAHAKNDVSIQCFTQ